MSTKPPKDRYDKYKNYRRHQTSLKCFKVPLTDIIKDTSHIDLIEDAVIRMNNIVIHTYQFLKSYYLYQYVRGSELPVIDKVLVARIMKVISYASKNTDSQNKEETNRIMNELRNFNDTVYSKMSGKLQLSREGLTQMIGDQSISIVTCYENHIQEHFSDIVRGYVNMIADKKVLIEKHGKKVVLRELQKVKNDILNSTRKSSAPFIDIVDRFNKYILKDFEVTKSLESMADTKSKMNLLLLMVRMSIDAEEVTRSRQAPEDRGNLFRVINCFPLRTSNIPAYVDFDSELIISVLMTHNRHLIPDGMVMDNYARKKWDYRNDIWDMFFKPEHSAFRKTGYTFNYRISTDGVGCSIVFIRSDLFRDDKRVKIGHKPKPRGFNSVNYIDRIDRDEWNEIVDRYKRSGERAFVGIDPGKRDLIFCTNGQTKFVPNKDGTKIKRKTTTFRYSNGQRKQETKSDIFRKRMEREKDKVYSYGKTITEIESSLSIFNSSSCIWSKHRAYLTRKCTVNRMVEKYYQRKKHRLQKWYGYLNKRRSEANMLNRFEKTFGTPKDVVIMMGDWSENKPMRYQEPTMGKSIRKLFRDRGYPLFLVDEYNTSKRLYVKGTELKNFRKYKDGRKVHRVLACPLVTESVSHSYTTTSHPPKFLKKVMDSTDFRPVIINRDLNGSLNIRLRGMHTFIGAGVPQYLSRSKNAVDNSSDESDLKGIVLDLPESRLTIPVKDQKKVVKTAKIVKTPKIQRSYTDNDSEYESSDEMLERPWVGTATDRVASQSAGGQTVSSTSILKSARKNATTL